MLSGSTIDEIVGGVRRCHRELTVHGVDVILDRLVTANKPFARASAPESSSQFPAAAAASSSSTSSPTATCQPDIVALAWTASRPWPHSTKVFQPLLRERDWKKWSNFTYLHIDPKQLVIKIDPGEGTTAVPPRVADLVVWHHVPRVLEMQADAGFTDGSVTNAFARELAIDAAQTMLLDYIEQGLAANECHHHGDNNDDDSPEGNGDRTITEFVARFKANLITMVKEASASPKAFSVSHSLLPDDVEDRLREESARNRRKRVDGEQDRKLWKEYEAAVEARKTSDEAGGAPASSAPAAGNIPEKPKPRSGGAEPVSPDPLAASPPLLVLRPFEDLFRVFAEADMMEMFRKVILTQRGCVLCPGFEVWFEKKGAVIGEGGVVRHEFVEETGNPYC